MLFKNFGNGNGRAVDPHSFLADPDPAVLLNADLDPAAFLNADPYPQPWVPEETTR